MSVSVLAAGGDDRYLLNNQIVTIDGDEAVAETYAYVVGERPWFDGAQRLVDRLARTDDGWGIVERQVLDNRVGR